MKTLLRTAELLTLLGLFLAACQSVEAQKKPCLVGTQVTNASCKQTNCANCLQMVWMQDGAALCWGATCKQGDDFLTTCHKNPGDVTDCTAFGKNLEKPVTCPDCRWFKCDGSAIALPGLCKGCACRPKGSDATIQDWSKWNQCVG